MKPRKSSESAGSSHKEEKKKIIVIALTNKEMTESNLDRIDLAK